jgi:putative SOS response-associated peptidase YedK
MAQVHNRMPVILPPGSERAWLDPAAQEAELAQLLRPYPSDLMQMHAVSTRVTSPANDDATLVQMA